MFHSTEYLGRLNSSTNPPAADPQEICGPSESQMWMWRPSGTAVLDLKLSCRQPGLRSCPCTAVESALLGQVQGQEHPLPMGGSVWWGRAAAPCTTWNELLNEYSLLDGAYHQNIMWLPRSKELNCPQPRAVLSLSGTLNRLAICE